jgi:1-pyrroline-5-carboxylate dehydrogenase
MLKHFHNEALTDFGDPTHRAAFADAVAKVESKLGETHSLVIGGKEIAATNTFNSYNPANPSQIIGTFAKADAADARRAIAAAKEAFKAWSDWPVKRRAKLLFDTAAIMRKRRHEFSAAMVLETGKPWVEADADTAEGIDFCDFYARLALELQGTIPPITQIPSEHSELFYIPLGVGAVIPPWNFPFAILVGMTVGSIVAGNTVVLKPASDSPFIGRMAFDALVEAGMPPGVVNFLPGPGSTAGEELVTNADTRFIAFTGSKEVGLGIIEKAAKIQPGQIWIKRVMAEMGGKDTMVIDNMADIQAAAGATSAAAFGYAGQKCSACSRVIVHADIYDQFIPLLLDHARKIQVGDPRSYETGMGPVINKQSLEKCKKYLEIGVQEGRLSLGGKMIEQNGGYFLEPAIFEGIKPGARMEQEEIFGPILTVMKFAGDFEEMIQLANATEYGLTGSIYTNDRDRINYAKRHFHVGNLYVNRKCTGALVGAHPFGGFNMSGTDGKAGGSDYLLLFTQAKSVSEQF